MATGTIKYFSDQKGFGFITPDDAPLDHAGEIFVHRTDLVQPLRLLNSGDRVSYDLIESKHRKGNGKKAANVTLSRR